MNSAYQPWTSLVTHFQDDFVCTTFPHTETKKQMEEIAAVQMYLNTVSKEEEDNDNTSRKDANNNKREVLSLFMRDQLDKVEAIKDLVDKVNDVKDSLGATESSGGVQEQGWRVFDDKIRSLQVGKSHHSVGLRVVGRALTVSVACASFPPTVGFVGGRLSFCKFTGVSPASEGLAHPLVVFSDRAKC